jgi:hypothetical protein
VNIKRDLIAVYATVLAFGAAAHNHSGDTHANHKHGDTHGASAMMDHGAHDQMHDHMHQHDKSEQGVTDGEHEAHGAGAVTLTHTPDIDAALAEGGEPIVADVLGVVCDFCATAMNKIFGKREEVAAIYVDLDTKALSIVTYEQGSLSDEDIGSLAEQAGYRVAAVRRGAAALGS